MQNELNLQEKVIFNELTKTMVCFPNFRYICMSLVKTGNCMISRCSQNIFEGMDVNHYISCEEIYEGAGIYKMTLDKNALLETIES